MSRRERDQPYTSEELTDLLDTLPTLLPCRNPLCRGLVGYRPSGGGRQPTFCSRGCRTAFHNDRRRLERAWAALARVEPATSRQADRVRRVRARLGWSLTAYRLPGPTGV